MDNDIGQQYRKQNSFVEIRDRVDRPDTTLARVAALRATPESTRGLSPDHITILHQALRDLLDPDPTPPTPLFALTPHVVAEIATYTDDVLPRYLVHRYRYEMFPQQRRLDEYPPYLQIEPSSTCNFRCVFCFETDRVFTNKANGYMGHMSLDLFKRVVDQAEGNVEFLSLASRGEPLICPDIVPMLRYTRGKFLALKLNTNASLLDEAKCHAILESGVKTVVFSADAAAEPLYSQLRVNGRLSVVMGNIERFQRIRQTQYADSAIITRVSGVKVSDDQHLDAMETAWGGLADQVAFVQYNPWENVYDASLKAIASPCSDLWRRMFVWWDGKVNPCDVDYRSTLSVGAVPEGTLSTLWRSASYEQLRAVHATGKRHETGPCNRCVLV